jgi:hypothetical protein
MNKESEYEKKKRTYLTDNQRQLNAQTNDEEKGKRKMTRKDNTKE